MSKRSSLRSVVARVIAVSTLGAAAIGATLALFFVANARLKAANNASAHSATVSAAAFDVRGSVLAIDQALQAVVANYDASTVAQLAPCGARVGAAGGGARARSGGEQRSATAARPRSA